MNRWFLCEYSYNLHENLEFLCYNIPVNSENLPRDVRKTLLSDEDGSMQHIQRELPRRQRKVYI